MKEMLKNFTILYVDDEEMVRQNAVEFLSRVCNKVYEAKDGKEILVGNSPREYADHIIQLLDNTDTSETIANNAYSFVHRNYNWDAATKKLENLISGK